MYSIVPSAGFVLFSEKATNPPTHQNLSSRHSTHTKFMNEKIKWKRKAEREREQNKEVEKQSWFSFELE